MQRILSDSDATLSIVSIDGLFQCFGLEDEFREEKVASETRIPAGSYRVGVRAVGGFHHRYSRKFPGKHQGMLHVLDVPGFDYILIHIGNTDKDTAGCLLVGAGCNMAGDLSISSSKIAYADLYDRVIDAARSGDLTITYTDDG